MSGGYVKGDSYAARPRENVGRYEVEFLKVNYFFSAARD